MSNVQLPQFISPRKVARQGQVIEGTIPVLAMKRTEGLLVDTSGEVRVHLELSVDEEHFSAAVGSFSGQVMMRCERCMGATPVDVSADISLACVYTDEQAEVLPERYEPLLTVSDQTDLYALIEEELLLSLPIVAYHSNNSCSFGPSSFGDSEVSDVGDDLAGKAAESLKALDENNPFAVLAQLKSRT